MAQDISRAWRIGRAALAILLLAIGALLFWPVDIEPYSYKLSPDPFGTGRYRPNNHFADADLVKTGIGPEGIAIDANGRVYTGLADGRIIRIEADGALSELAQTGGRPLGVEFDQNGNLIIADAVAGLLRLSPAGNLRALTTQVNGKKMIFVDDLAIASDGKIWFSDASQRFGLHSNFDDILENQPTGRLLTYEPATKKTRVELDNLHFANGVALAADESFVLVNETFTYRVRRLWLKGPKKGQSDIFLDNLPGFPDNITTAPDGTFWIAFAAPRNPMLDFLADKPFWRKALYRLVKLGMAPGNLSVANIANYTSTGRLISFHQSTDGKMYLSTSVLEHDDKLYVGSLVAPHIAILDMDDY